MSALPSHVKLAALLVAGLPLAACSLFSGNPNEPLQVLLRGNSSAELAKLVADSGGTLTHELHIIDAVGARMTRHQLTRALDSGLVTYHVDDLARLDDPGDPPESNGEECEVRGQIEFTVNDDHILWPLYNKRDQPATWEKLDIHWPARFGRLERVDLDDAALAPALLRTQQDNRISIEFPSGQRPVVAERSTLALRFTQQNLQALTPLQREFHIEASFEGGCTDKMVPAYVNNHEDYYYNTVAGVNLLHRQGITGAGVTVAVIDSGLWEHPALALNTRGQARILARYDATTNTTGSAVLDESGHGTHMSSIIAHSGPTLADGEPTGWYRGVAPDANLVAVKVLDREGRAHFLDIARAIQWVIDHREQYAIRVLNISLGQVPRWPYWEDFINQTVLRAWAAGIVVVAAAGNDGPEMLTIDSPGNLPYAITVGAVTDSWTPDTRDDDYIPDFSSRGPTPAGHVKPDVVALGGHMTGLMHPESGMAEEDPENFLASGEFVSTGTSQATAMVSGIIALLLQLEPELSPDDIKCKLITSAEPAINADGRLAYSPFTQGYGYVTAPRTVTLGQTGCGNADMDISAELDGSDYYYGPTIWDKNGGTSLPDLDRLVAREPAAKGESDTRKWGVKEHIERLGSDELERYQREDLPINWLQIYLEEKAAIEALHQAPANNP
ncbi:MAG: hypothetical protein Hals2KO_30840 [Halioglobus sp.]